MPTSEQRNAMIDRISRLPALVRETIKDMSDAQLDTPYGPGKWTARQVVHHLADSHLNGYARMKVILTEDRPTLKTYDQVAWAKTADVVAQPVESSIQILDGLHHRWTVLLQSLADSDWGRAAKHPEHGDISLDWLLEIYASHGEKHMQKIADLRARHGW
jgi:hypothetical protein